MEKQLSILKIWAAVGSKIASSGLQCGLLALLAFLPIGGLALLSPQQVESDGSNEFMLAAVLLSRFMMPPVAMLIVAYLARKDARLSGELSLARAFKRWAFPSIGLVLAVMVFGLFSSLFFLLPGVAFFLASCVVLPVLVMEGVSSPIAVKRSWELTNEVRSTILSFFTSYFLLCGIAVAVLIRATSSRLPEFMEPLPFVQTDAFLPLVFVGALVYSGMVIATYEIYAQLVAGEKQSESPVQE
ncbi:MAG: hypothetical protein WC423_11775 [Vulcanimicrobiota bacterium]